jgi:septal ring factor EnvC (AmiA/AmiB activator)
MARVEQGVLTSLGILKPIVDRAKASQEALLQAKKDKEALENLIPQAKDIINKLTEIVNRSKVSKVRLEASRKYIRRSKEEIEEFIKEWEDDGNDRNEVAEAFGFNSYSSAYNFWVNHKKRL